MPAPRGLQSLAPIQPSDGIEAHEAANDYIDECGFKDRNGLRASWKAKNRVRACRQLGSGGGEAGSRPGFAASEATVLLSYATNPRNSRRDSNPDLVIGQKRRLKIRSSPPGRGVTGCNPRRGTRRPFEPERPRRRKQNQVIGAAPFVFGRGIPVRSCRVPKSPISFSSQAVKRLPNLGSPWFPEACDWSRLRARFVQNPILADHACSRVGRP